MQKLERTLFERGRFSEIEQIYRDILGARRDDDTTVSLAAFYDKQGRADDAIDLLENFVSEGSGSVRASMMLTSLYARHRDPETVEKFLEQSSAVAPTNNHYRCSYCKLVSDHMRWHCPRCNRFDSFTRNHVD
jgi:lipopolysaccharide biosynthesis regulator YciM